MNYQESQDHPDYLKKELTIREAIDQLEKFRAVHGGDAVVHIQSHGCCPYNHAAWIVDRDDELGEVVLRG